MIPTTIRTGFGPEEGDNGLECADQVIALMRVFMKDAILVSGRYTHAHGRKVVRAVDMQKALKYCARIFFNRDENEVHQLLHEERVEMDREDQEEDEEEEEDKEEEGEEEEEDEEEEEGEEEEEDEEDESDEEEAAHADPLDVQLAKNVDTVVNVWHLWSPADPVHIVLKRAIDNTHC